MNIVLESFELIVLFDVNASPVGASNFSIISSGIYLNCRRQGYGDQRANEKGRQASRLRPL